MTQQIIDIGIQGNDGTGDSIRESFNKVNANFTEIYAIFGAGGSIKFGNLADAPGNSTFSVVSATGNGSIATINFTNPNPGLGLPFSIGQNIIVTGNIPTSYNGNYIVTNATTTSVTFTSSGSGALTQTGKIAGSSYSANQIIMASTTGSSLTARNVVGGNGITIDASNNQQLVINSNSGGLITDPQPTLGTHMNADAFIIGNLADPDPSLVSQFNAVFASKGYTTTLGQMAVTVNYANNHYLQVTNGQIVGPLRVRAMPSVAQTTDPDYNASLTGNYVATEAIQRQHAVLRDGDTMTGLLELSDHPGSMAGYGIRNGNDDLQAATKFYVDNNTHYSNVNLYVSTGGDDTQRNTPPGREGRAPQYAYKSVGAALLQAQNLINLAFSEPGPYRQTIAYTIGPTLYTSSITGVTFSGGNSAVQGYLDAASLLEANKSFIQAETIAYLNNKYVNAFTFDKTRYANIMSNIVNGIAYDLALGTTFNSTTQASILFDGYNADVSGNLTTILAAIKNASQQITNYSYSSTNLQNYLTSVINAVCYDLEFNSNYQSIQVALGFNYANTGIETTPSIINTPATATSGTATGSSCTISGTTMIVGGTVVGYFAVGMTLSGAGILNGTTIIALGTGTGGAGSYTISSSYGTALSDIKVTGVNNTVTVGSTQGMVVNAAIVFTGTSFGNIVPGNTYYITSIVDSTHITISSSYGGSNYSLTTATGSLEANTTAPSEIVGILTNLGTQISALSAVATSSTISSSIETILANIGNIIVTGSVPNPTFPPVVSNTGLTSAVNLLLNNISFIQAEVIAYLLANYPTVTYNKTTCQRDVKYIVWALCYDLTYGGNSQSIHAGLQYWINAVLQIASYEQAATVSAIGYIGVIAQNIVQNQTPVKLYQTGVIQYENSTLSGGSVATSSIAANITTIQSIVGSSSQLSPTVVAPTTSSVSTTLATAVSAIKANTTTLESNAISFVNNNFPIINNTLQQTTINTLFGIITSILSNGINSRTTPTYSTTGLGASIVQAQAAILANIPFITAETNAWINVQYPAVSYSATSSTRDLTYVLEAVVYDITYGGNAATTQAANLYYANGTNQLTTGLPAVCSAALNHALNVTQTVIANSVVTPSVGNYITTTGVSVTGGYATVTFANQGSVPYTINQVITIQGMTPGNYNGYWTVTGCTATSVTFAISSNYGSQTVAGKITTQVQNASWTLSSGQSSTVNTLFNIVTGVINSGTLVTPTYPSISSASSSLQTTFGIIQNNAYTISQNVVSYLSTTFAGGFSYNQATCYRDIGYIIDAQAIDLLTDGTYQSITAGKSYYKNVSAKSIAIGTQLTETIDGIQFAQQLAVQVLNQTTQSRYQSLVTQQVNSTIVIGTNTITGTAGTTVTLGTQISLAEGQAIITGSSISTSGGLGQSTTYYVAAAVTNSFTVTLASSYANAIAGIPLTFSTLAYSTNNVISITAVYNATVGTNVATGSYVSNTTTQLTLTSVSGTIVPGMVITGAGWTNSTPVTVVSIVSPSIVIISAAPAGTPSGTVTLTATPVTTLNANMNTIISIINGGVGAAPTPSFGSGYYTVTFSNGGNGYVDQGQSGDNHIIPGKIIVGDNSSTYGQIISYTPGVSSANDTVTLNLTRPGFFTYIPTTASGSSGSSNITVASTTYTSQFNSTSTIVVGLGVTGTNIPLGATVTAINGNVITLSSPLSANITSGSVIFGELLDFGETVADQNITVFVESGIYYEDYPLKLSANVTIRGDDFRRTIIRPLNRISQSPWRNTFFYRDSIIDGMQIGLINFSGTDYAAATNSTASVSGTTGNIQITLGTGQASPTWIGYVICDATSETGTAGKAVINTVSGNVMNCTVVYPFAAVKTYAAGTWHMYNTLNYGRHYLSNPLDINSTPLNNKNIDVFLVNDATRIKLITCQGHGGFMMVLDPEGQIKTKSPYGQESASFSGSINRQRFAGGQLIDGFAGRLFGTITGVSNNGYSITVTGSLNSGLDVRAPQTPCAFYIQGNRYQINNVLSYNSSTYTVVLGLDTSTPFYPSAVYSNSTLTSNIASAVDAAAYDMAFGSNYQSIKTGITFLQPANSVVGLSSSIVTQSFSYINQQIAALGNVDSAGQTAISNNLTIINNIIINGVYGSTSGIPTVVLPNPANVTTNVANAKLLLQANKAFIQAEVVARVSANYNVASYSGYSALTLSNNMGFVIDAITYDLLYGGNSSVYDVVQWLYNSTLNTLYTAAVGYVNTVAGQVIQKTTVTRSNGNTQQQVTTGYTAATSTEASTITTLVAVLTDYFSHSGSFNSSTRTLPTVSSTTTTSSLSTDWTNIEAAKTSIQSNTITYANNGAGIAINIEMGGNKSMLANDFTQINDLGYGILCTNAGLTEQVSTFTYYCYTAYWALNGGQIRSVAGSNSNGVYGLRGTGSDVTELPNAVNLSNNMPQSARVYKQGTYATAMTPTTTTQALNVYITNWEYVPYGTSELEIDHTLAGGGITRYEVSTVSHTAVNVNGQNVLSLTLSTSGDNQTSTNGLAYALYDGQIVTIRNLTNIKFYNISNVKPVRPSTALQYTNNLASIYRIISYGLTEATGESLPAHQSVLTMDSSFAYYKFVVDTSNMFNADPTVYVTSGTVALSPASSISTTLYVVTSSLTGGAPSIGQYVGGYGFINTTVTNVTTSGANTVITLSVAPTIAPIGTVWFSTSTMGGLVGDNKIAVLTISDSATISQLNLGSYIFSWNGRTHRIIKYVTPSSIASGTYSPTSGPIFNITSGTSISSAASYTGVAQTSTSGSGTGAVFTITKTGNGTSYSGATTITATTLGSGYAIGDTITIAGANLGGSTPANNLVFTITGYTLVVTGLAGTITANEPVTGTGFNGTQLISGTPVLTTSPGSSSITATVSLSIYPVSQPSGTITFGGAAVNGYLQIDPNPVMNISSVGVGTNAMTYQSNVLVTGSNTQKVITFNIPYNTLYSYPPVDSTLSVSGNSNSKYNGNFQVASVVNTSQLTVASTALLQVGMIISTSTTGSFVETTSTNPTGTTIIQSIDSTTQFTVSPAVWAPAGTSISAILVAVVSSITITNAGSNYTSAPILTFSGGGATSQALATCTISNGSISTVTLVSPGYGYTSTPTITISGNSGSAYNTTTGTNIITLNSSANLQVNQIIIFGGSVFGNIQAGVQYYIATINGNQITISASSGGVGLISLTTASGPSMTWYTPGNAILTPVLTNSPTVVTTVVSGVDNLQLGLVYPTDPGTSGSVTTTTNATASITSSTISSGGVLTVGTVGSGTVAVGMILTGGPSSGSGIAQISSYATTATSGNGTTATITFAAQSFVPYAVGQTIFVSGVTPTGYNGTYVVTAATTSSVSYSNTTTGSQTIAGTVASTVYTYITSNISGSGNGSTWQTATSQGNNFAVTSSSITGTNNLLALSTVSNISVGNTITFAGTTFGGVSVTTVTAGSFVVGQTYTITSVGTASSTTTVTNFTSIGAANNNVGTVFTATGAGSGSGQALVTYYITEVVGSSVAIAPAKGSANTTLTTASGATLTFYTPSYGFGTSYTATTFSSVSGTGPYLVTLNIPTTTAPSTSVYYYVSGNSNALYNGYWQATTSSTTSITLSYPYNPGTYGVGSITTITRESTSSTSSSLGISKPFNPSTSTTLRIGYPATGGAQITVRISTCRATGHDFLDIGTGGFITSNYPNQIYGNAAIASNDANDVVEETTGRVFHVSTDQNGIFRVGRFFKVDQGTGTVTFSASIALSNLDGLGFKRGVVVSEFSTDPYMTGNAADSVPVQSAVRSFIDYRLGLDYGGNPVATSSLIGPGYLALNGVLGMKGNLNMASYQIGNLTMPNSAITPYDAANRGYVDVNASALNNLFKLNDQAIGAVATFVSFSSTGNTVTLSGVFGTILVGMVINGTGFTGGQIVTSVNITAGATQSVGGSGTVTLNNTYNTSPSGTMTFNNLNNGNLHVYDGVYGQWTNVPLPTTTANGNQIGITYTHGTPGYFTATILSGVVVNSAVSASAGIAQSKLALQAATAQPSGQSSYQQSTLGLSSFNNQVFTSTNGWINLAQSASVQTGYVSGGTSGTSTTMVVVSTNNIVPGMVVSGIGFTSSTQVVLSVTNSTTLVLSAVADGIPSGTLTFANSGIGLPYLQQIGTGYVLGNLSGSSSSPTTITPGAVVSAGDGLKNALFSVTNSVTSNVNSAAMLVLYDGITTADNTYGVIGITTSGSANKLVKTGSDGSLSAALLNIGGYKAISSAGSTISYFTPGQFTFMTSQDVSGSATTTISGVLNASGTLISTTLETGASVSTPGTMTGQWSLGALSSFNFSAGTLQSNNLTAGSSSTAGTFTGAWTFSQALTTNGITNTGNITSNGTNSATFYGSGSVGGSSGVGPYVYTPSGSGTGAIMAFHRAGSYAINMGLDSDNVLRIGGWSDGANTYRLQLDASGNLTTRGTHYTGGVQTTVITTGDPYTAGTITGAWTLTANSTLNATWADLAEYYEGDQDYEPGTVLVFGGDKEVTTTTVINDTRSAGVVTTNPAYVMNAEQTGIKVCIALAGRVPVKVVGRVKKGDMLTTSATPGYAVKALTPTLGAVIGKALEDKDYGEAGVIQVAVGRV